MSTSATWTVNNPVAGQEYIAPSAYWVVPASGSSVSVTCQTFDGNGNLTSVSSITAIRRNVTAGSDAGSYTYSGGNTATSTGSVGTNGSNVFAPAGKVGSSCAQLRMYISYTGSVYDQPPNAPSNLTPTGTVTTLTPGFTGSFSDPTSGDTLAQYEIVVNNASNGGGSQIWDSGNVAASSSEISAATFSRVYGGSALAWGSSYSFKARVANQNGNWGPWSGWANFSTAQGPNPPTITAPTGTQTTTTPGASATYSSPAGTAMASYLYYLYSGATQLYSSGWVTQSVASGGSWSWTLPGGILQYGQTYTLYVYVKDTNGAQSGSSSAANFSVAALPQVAPSTPSGGVTVTTQTPTFVWSYSSASGYAQGQAQVEVQNASTSSDLVLTGWMSQSATQWVSTTSIPYGTQIRWRVQVKDTSGLASGWSAWAYAYVNNAPSATITAPTNNATVATVTPSVTWTYTPSTGGQAQASASVTLMDASSNPLATYAVSGAATSYTLPSGVLINSTVYRLQVSVTDTNSVTGQSAVVTITISLTPPADMAGQPLASAKNWLQGALLNTDSNSDGIADNWTANDTSGVSVTAAIDAAITQPAQLASGDGPILGAQRLAVTGGVTAAGQYAGITQTVHVGTAGWTPGTTVLSAKVQAIVSGTLQAVISINFITSGGTFISNVKSSTPLTDTSGASVTHLGPQNVVIPATTEHIDFTLQLQSTASGQTGTAWFCDVQLEAAASSDANFIEGSLGTGYSYDANGYSVRTEIAGNIPTVMAVPGADTDPASAYGGSIVFSWDTTLADTRFTAYLIERRRQDQSTDDTAWLLLATLTNSSQGSYTDYAAASQTTYQYAVRQQIQYASGGVGVSQHRAIATGSVDFAPAWYLTNAGQAGAPVYNMRLRYVQSKRQLQWKERATYSAFLGRVGAARDAGQPAGYVHSLVCYFTELRGDSRIAIRRQLVTMQRLGGVWWLKDPNGMSVPVFIQDITFDDEATYSETMLTATLSLLQAQDTEDY